MTEKKKKQEFLENSPDWVMDFNSINEVRFCKYFVEKNPMVCIGGKLLSIDGEIDMEKLSSDVSREIM